MPSIAELASEQYLLLTTFRKDATAVATPVWIAPLDGGQMGFWTSSTSGKVKRIRNNPSVTVQPCDARGRIRSGSEVTPCTAAMVTSGSTFADIQRAIPTKYGVMVPVSKVFNTIGAAFKGKKQPYGDTGIVLTPQS